MNNRSEYVANLALKERNTFADMIHNDEITRKRQEAYEAAARKRLQDIRRSRRLPFWSKVGAIAMGTFAGVVFVGSCALVYPGFRHALAALLS